MGNPMTPFVPPVAAYRQSLTTLSASNFVISSPITAQQAKNSVFRITGTATNGTVSFLQFPTTAEVGEYIFQNTWVGTPTTSQLAIAAIGGGGTAQYLDSNLTISAAFDGQNWKYTTPTTVTY